MVGHTSYASSRTHQGVEDGGDLEVALLLLESVGCMRPRAASEDPAMRFRLLRGDFPSSAFVRGSKSATDKHQYSASVS